LQHFYWQNEGIKTDTDPSMQVIRRTEKESNWEDSTQRLKSSENWTWRYKQHEVKHLETKSAAQTHSQTASLPEKSSFDKKLVIAEDHQLSWISNATSW